RRAHRRGRGRARGGRRRCRHAIAGAVERQGVSALAAAERRMHLAKRGTAVPADLPLVDLPADAALPGLGTTTVVEAATNEGAPARHHRGAAPRALREGALDLALTVEPRGCKLRDLGLGTVGIG